MQSVRALNLNQVRLAIHGVGLSLERTSPLF